MESDLGRAWIESGDSPRRFLALADRLMGPHTERWVKDAVLATSDADAVVFSATASGFPLGAEKRGVPAIALAFVPLVPSAEIGASGIPRWMTPFAPMRRYVATLVLRALWKGAYPRLQEQRVALGLRPMTHKSVAERIRTA